MNSCALVSGTPWDQSVADPLSGQRTAASRLFRSSSADCGTCTVKGERSFVAAGSTSNGAFLPLSWALIGSSPSDNKPAPPVTAAVRMNLRRELTGTAISPLCSKPSSMSCSNPSFQIWCAAEHLRGIQTTARSLGSPRPAGVSQLVGEELWLLERGEVPTSVELIPVEQVRPQCLSPGFWRDEYLVRKDGRRHWQLDPSARRARHAGSGILPVDSGRRRSGVCEPVEADVVEHRVYRQRIFRVAAIVGPCLELLVDPQRLTRGRVCKRIAYGLRTRPLLAKIAALVV